MNYYLKKIEFFTSSKFTNRVSPITKNAAAILTVLCSFAWENSYNFYKERGLIIREHTVNKLKEYSQSTL